MNRICTSEEISALNEVCEVLEEVRNSVKDEMHKYHCHLFPEQLRLDILRICEQIEYILEKLGISLDELKDLKKDILQTLDCTDEYKVSDTWKNNIFENITVCIDRLHTLMDGDDRRIIRIKYVDFYPEFIPQEHWLYPLLAEKYKVVPSDNPDYLIFSCFGRSYLKYNCIRIFISNEAVYPNFNLYDYAVTYADFEASDRLLQNRDAFEDIEVKELAHSREEAAELLQGKSKFCNFVYSNNERDPYCMELFRQISEYKQVTSGGRFLNNIGYAVKDILEFQRGFKFSIACENSYYKGYTTEKLVNALRAGTIPIYWGNPDVSEFINSKAIINCHDYDSIEDVVKEIERLDNDDEAYMEKLQQPIFVNDSFREDYLLKRKKFIYNIFDQKYAKAFRRNTGLRGQWINDWFCWIMGYPNEWFSEERNFFVRKKNSSLE